MQPRRGRGGGDAPKIARLAAKEEEQRRRQATERQPAGATEVGRPTSSTSEGQAERTIRGRGGFGGHELRLIPSGIRVVKAEPAEPRGQVELVSNFIKINPMPDRHVFQYRVDFEPNIESTKLRGKLFAENVEPKFTNQMVVFDGMSDARSGHGSHDELTVVANHPTQADAKITITVKRVGKVDNQFEQIRLYNMHMKKYLRALGFFRVSNTGAYVHPELKTRVGQTDLLTIRGYRTSANVHEGGAILMNLESVHKLMQSKNVLQVLVAMSKYPNFRVEANTSLSGKLVVTNYNNHVYRIEEVIFSKSPSATFPDKNTGKDVSFVEYYKNRYGKEIQDIGQPMLRCVPNSVRRGESAEGREALLVPELCNIAGLTNAQRADNRLKIDLIKSSQIAPEDRAAHLRLFMDKLHNNTEVKQALNKWGYTYGTTPVTIKARVLPVGGVGLGRHVNAQPDRWPRVDESSGGFEREVMKEKIAKPAPFKKLIILISRTDWANKDNIAGQLKSGFVQVGCVPSAEEYVQILEGDTPQLYLRYLRNIPSDTTATLVVLPRQNKNCYDAVKKFATVERGMITQVVTARLILDERKARGASIKIGVQVAAKIGAEPWYIYIPLSKAMVCGYDTYHDTSNRGRSFGAFVASMNGKFSRWFSKADSHDRLDELSAHLAGNFVLALRKYKALNGHYPDRVFIYRDGVSDGQLEHVLNSELKAVMNALKGINKELSDSDKIRLTYIVVNKRIGARFYLKRGNFHLNPPPGTVVDDVVTRKERYDFYLVSQSTRHGTVAPTYYSILHDESGLDPAKHQMLAFKLCLLYYNWTGTVRVPAPCQYAHKLALLCGEHLHAVPNSSLDDRLHFL